MHKVENSWIGGRLDKWKRKDYVVRTTDAHSGNYAAVLHLWYNWDSSLLTLGECGNKSGGVTDHECEVGLPHKLYGVSGFYKYIVDSVQPNDTYKKVTMLNIKTYKRNKTTDKLVLLRHDSLQFERSNVYKEFYLPVTYTDTTVTPDSVSIWFESKGYQSGTTYYTYNHFLYLDDLQFHYQPRTLSINKPSLKKKIKIFPNPADKSINLDYASDINIENLWLSDASGRIIKTCPGGCKTLDISEVAKGIYFLNIEAREGSTTEQVVIQ